MYALQGKAEEFLRHSSYERYRQFVVCIVLELVCLRALIRVWRAFNKDEKKYLFAYQLLCVVPLMILAYRLFHVPLYRQYHHHNQPPYIGFLVTDW